MFNNNAINSIKNGIKESIIDITKSDSILYPFALTMSATVSVVNLVYKRAISQTSLKTDSNKISFEDLSNCLNEARNFAIKNLIEKPFTISSEIASTINWKNVEVPYEADWRNAQDDSIPNWRNAQDDPIPNWRSI